MDRHPAPAPTAGPTRLADMTPAQREAALKWFGNQAGAAWWRAQSPKLNPLARRTHLLLAAELRATTDRTTAMGRP